MLNWIPVSQAIHEGMAVYRDNPEKRPVIETSREFAVHGMHESIQIGRASCRERV